MTRVHAIVLLLLCLLVTDTVRANGEDSLRQSLKTTSQSHERTALLLKLAELKHIPDSTALSYYDQAVSESKKSGIDALIVQTLLKKCTFLADRGKWIDASEVVDELRPFEETSLPDDLKFDLYYAIGDVYIGLGNPSAAQGYFMQALNTASRSGNHSKDHLPRTGLAKVYTQQKFYDKALGLLEQQLKDTVNTPPSWIQKSYYAIGGIKISQGDPEEAFRYWQKSRSFPPIPGDREYLANMYQVNSGIAQYQIMVRQDIDSCIFYLKESQKYATEMESPEYLGEIHSNFGSIYFTTGNAEKALTHLREAEKYGELTGSKRILRDVYLNMSDCYTLKGDYKKALEYHQIATDITLEMASGTTTRKLVQMQKDFEFQKERDANEQKVERAKLEAQNAKLQLDAASTRTTALIIGIISLLAIIALVLFAFLRNRRSKQEIARKNELLNSSLEEKELLLKEIHHRVKNNLQLVSSLLDTQANKIQDDEVLSIFQEGQNRVQAMSLIHQKLYQGENLGQINFKDYLEELVQYFTSAGDMANQLQVNIDHSDVQLDIDTAIPLGLIVNELMTNSIKHAFSNHTNPEIRISIEKETEGNYRLNYADNGEGLPQDLDLKKTKTLGIRLVRSLAKQLLGKMEYKLENSWSAFAITFKDQFSRNLTD